MKALYVIGWLFGLAFATTSGQAQTPGGAFQVDTVSAQGIHLKQGWRFYPGDIPGGAKPGLDDSHWQPIDPTRDIRDLPAVQQAGVGWLRLRITTGPNLPPVLAYMFQSVASEVYLDGRLIYTFGTLSNRPDRVRAYNPYAALSLPLQLSTQHVLALRIAVQPGLDYTKSYLGRPASVVRFDLFPAAEIPAIPLFNIESVYLDTFKIGISFILFILHLALFMAYRRQRANLYAAGMYALLCAQFGLRAASDLMHSVEARMILAYGPLTAPFIAGLALLIFYTLFDLPKKGWFWAALGSIVLVHSSLLIDFPWLKMILDYYVSFELIRICVGAIRGQRLGARIVLTGVLTSIGIGLILLIVGTWSIPITGNEWLFHGLYNGVFLCIPLALSLRLALEHGWVNRQLNSRLREVQELSARNLAQQQQRQQLLADQNEYLERQVAERTGELRQQALQLRELDAVKSRFVTNLTHEFRTPLSLIISPVGKLLDDIDSLPDGVHRSLQTIDRNARHLLSQVNQLLDVAQLQEGRLSLNTQPVDLNRFTAQLVDLFNSPAEAQQITLTHQMPGDDVCWLIDTDKWGKIVYNLLANALKFTPPGGQVAVRLDVDDEWAELVISDTGIGIAADKLPFIFDRFYQADDHTTRPYAGTGVGLAIVRELTDLMGGTVSVDSQPGIGSTFRIRLPVQRTQPDLSGGEAPQLPVAVLLAPPVQRPINNSRVVTDDQSDRALILLVEDNDELRQFMAHELETRYRVLTASNGRQGWELTRQHLPDLVISDVMMPRLDGPGLDGPGLDGLDLTNQIRSCPDTDHIGIILVTARSSHDNRLEGLRKGADDYLVKPFDLNELQLRVHNLIVHQQKIQEHHRRQLIRQNPDRNVLPTLAADPFLEQIYRLLESHLDDPQIGVAWLADQLAMDRKTLYRKLRSKINLSANELIRTYRLGRACELLESGKTITETAYSTGFDSLTYFGHCFREQYQLSPTEFLNQINRTNEPVSPLVD